MVESQGPEHLSSVSHCATHLLSDFGQAVLSRLTFPCLSYLVSSEGHGKCKYANTHVTCSLQPCGLGEDWEERPGGSRKGLRPSSVPTVPELAQWPCLTAAAGTWGGSAGAAVQAGINQGWSLAEGSCKKILVNSSSIHVNACLQ